MQPSLATAKRFRVWDCCAASVQFPFDDWRVAAPELVCTPGKCHLPHLFLSVTEGKPLQIASIQSNTVIYASANLTNLGGREI